MSTGRANAFDRDEVTQRTALAIQAEQEAFKAQMSVLDVKRTAKRMNWVWGVLITIGAIFSVGYAFHDWKEHFATKSEVDQMRVNADADRIERRLLLQRVDSINERSTRLEDKLDRLLLRDRRSSER